MKWKNRHFFLLSTQFRTLIWASVMTNWHTARGIQLVRPSQGLAGAFLGLAWASLGLAKAFLSLFLAS